METNRAASQLADVNRLRTATIRESGGALRSALLVMAVATVLYFSGYSWHSPVYSVVGPVVWTGFVVAWVWWLRHGKRAIAGPPLHSRDERRRAIVLWAVLLIVANLIVAVASQVSWATVGIALAALGTITGAVTALRSRAS